MPRTIFAILVFPSGSDVMPAKAGIQYAAVAAMDALTLWNTGSPLSRGRQLNAG
jgi:hypothetical protein